MRHVWLASLLALLLAACGETREPVAAGAPVAAEALADNRAAPAPGGPAAEVNRYLAYEHWLELETDPDGVRVAYQAALDACKAAAAQSCAILGSRLSSGEYPGASLELRVTHDGIPRLTGALAQKGTITSQSTTAEDLSGPIQDNDKQLAMLRDYRTQLEALLTRGQNDVEALIKLRKELATVQSELEARTGERAHLMQRVQTELLHVTIRTPAEQSSWHRLGRALSGFGATLAHGTAIMITGMAYVLPWLAVICALVWGVLRLRRVMRSRRGR